MGHKLQFPELKPVYFYNLLFAYVLLSILWWSYLLMYNNRQNYIHDMAIIEQLDHSNAREIPSNNLYRDYLQKQILILIEALTFFILVVLGARRVYRSQQKAIHLAKQQSNFLLSITHELKSPLSGIKITLETMARHSLSKEEEARFIANAMDDTNRLNKLIEDILLAARFEDSGFSIANDSIEISDLIGQLTKEYALKSNRVISHVEPDIFIHGDEGLIEIAVRNLIENALKYSDDKAIELTIKNNTSSVEISVADYGPGIDQKEKAHVFRKFYRIGDENTRQQKGTGLGLYIVDEIVKHHKGKVRIQDNKPSGTIFIVSLPLILQGTDNSRER